MTKYSIFRAKDNTIFKEGVNKSPKSSKRCSRCILPSDYPTVNYNKKGECNVCTKWNEKWGQIDFKKQAKRLEKILSKFRGRNKPYDCVIGLSGGKDSCYVAYQVKKMGLNPLAVTFDNGFLSEGAKLNVNLVIKTLSIDHLFVREDKDFMLKKYRQFFLTAGEFCSVCETGIRAAVYQVAKSHKIRLIIAGSSPRTEANLPYEVYCCTPGYFHNIARKYFSKKEVKDSLFVGQRKRIIGHMLKRALYLKLPNYLPWDEREILKELTKELNVDFPLGQEHTDCEMHDAREYLLFKKFGFSMKCSKLSSLIRDKQITREYGLKLLKNEEIKLIEQEKNIRKEIKKRFNISEKQIDEVIKYNHLDYVPKTDIILRKVQERFYL